MANKNNHYEAAFEAYLRRLNLPYIPSLETHRSRLSNGSTIKNLDFIVSIPGRRSWLVDIKGRLFPGGRQRRCYWKQWATHDDLVGLLSWESLFGREFQGLLVFAYRILGDRSPVPEEKLFPFRKRDYAFVGIKLTDYLSDVRLISPKWRTYSISASRFRSLARPFDEIE